MPVPLLCRCGQSQAFERGRDGLEVNVTTRSPAVPLGILDNLRVLGAQESWIWFGFVFGKGAFDGVVFVGQDVMHRSLSPGWTDRPQAAARFVSVFHMRGVI